MIRSDGINTWRVGDFWADQTQLLCHFNGGNGSAVFTDVKGLALAGQPEAAQSTAQVKWGTSSGLFLGGAASADTRVGLTSPSPLAGNDFTLEAWVYVVGVNAAGSAQAIIGRSLVGNQSYTFGYLNDLQTISFSYTTDGTGATLAAVTGVGPALTGGWHHITAERFQGTLSLYVDGVLVSTPTAVPAIYNQGGAIVTTLGGTNFAGAFLQANAYMDDIRMTVGVARYRKPFAVPTAAFPDR